MKKRLMLLCVGAIVGVVIGVAKMKFGEKTEEEEVETFEEATDVDGDDGVISFAGEEGVGIDIAPETDEEDIPEEPVEETESLDEEVHAWEEDDAIYESPKDHREIFELIGEREFETTQMDHTKTKLTYYVKDDILADDEKMMEASIEDTIGHEVMGLLINNPYSYSLYVRYPTLGADYEVKMDPGSFADAFKELDVGGTD